VLSGHSEFNLTKLSVSNIVSIFTVLIVPETFRFPSIVTSEVIVVESAVIDMFPAPAPEFDDWIDSVVALPESVSKLRLNVPVESNEILEPSTVNELFISTAPSSWDVPSTSNAPEIKVFPLTSTVKSSLTLIPPFAFNKPVRVVDPPTLRSVPTYAFLATAKPPSTTTAPTVDEVASLVEFKLIIAVSAVEPTSIVVAAPNAFTVVAVAFNKLNDVPDVVRSPPFTARSPVKVVFSLTPRVPAIKTSPSESTVNLSFEPFLTKNVFVLAVVFPLIVVTPFITVVSTVTESPRVVDPPTLRSVPTYAFLATAKPPSITTAPTVEELASLVEFRLITAVFAVEPTSIVVAAPNAFTVVAFVFNKLNDVPDVVRSPPFTAKSLVKVVSPVTFNTPAMSV